jgi:hypothetical protein
MSVGIPENLPGALIEETFYPEHIVAHRQPDGSVHLMMYVGSAGSENFLHLKYAIISAEHSALFAGGPEPAPSHPDSVFHASPRPFPDQRPGPTVSSVGPAPPAGAAVEQPGVQTVIDSPGIPENRTQPDWDLIT